MRKHADSPGYVRRATNSDVGREQNESRLQSNFSIKQESIYLYVAHRSILNVIITNGSVYVICFSQRRIISRALKERGMDGWKEGRIESSWRIGVCPNTDSLLAESGGRDGRLRAQSFPACLVPYIDRPAEIKENMNRDLGITVIHMDHTELLPSGLQSY